MPSLKNQSLIGSNHHESIKDKVSRFFLALHAPVLSLLGVLILLAPYSKSAVKVAMVVIAVYYFSVKLLDFKSSVRETMQNPFFLSILLLWGLVLGTVFFSSDFAISQSIFFNRWMLYLGGILFGYHFVQNEKSQVWLTRYLILAGAVLIVGAIYYYFRFKPTKLLRSFTAHFLIRDYLPIYTAFFIVAAYLSTGISLRILLATLAILSLISCLATASIGIFLSVMMTFLFLPLFIGWRKILVTLFAIGILSAGFCLLPKSTIEDASLQNRLPLFQTFRREGAPVNYFNYFFVKDNRQKKPHYRQLLWDPALRMFRDQPFYGLGLGMYERKVYEYAPEIAVELPTVVHAHAHSDGVELLAETGLIGFLAYIYFFANLLIVFLKKVHGLKGRDKKGYAYWALSAGGTSVFATVLYGMVNNLIFVSVGAAIVFWIMVGLVMGLLVKDSSNRVD